MIRPINIYENEKTMLENKCVPCEPAGLLTGAIDQTKYPWSETVIQLAEDLLDTAISLDGRAVGVAAPQIWTDKSIPCPSMFIMHWPLFDEKPMRWGWKVIINPKITLSGKKVKRPEGCLSIPGKVHKVFRRTNAEMTFCDLGSTEPQTVKFYGTVSPAPYIVQHEMDHLNGGLICQH